MTKKQRLIRRVNKLLENKSNKFKRKYFLLSALARTNIKKSKKLISEAECYANVLMETNGEKPAEEFLIKLNEEALSFSGNKNVQKQIKFIKDYNNMLNSQGGLLKESIIEEELSSILNNDYRLNEKLLDTLMESINKRKCLLLESDGETDIDSFEELEKIIDDQEQGFEDLDEEDFEEEDEDLHRDFSDKEIKDMQAFKSDPQKISLSKLGYKRDKYVPGEKKARYTALEKAGQAAIFKIQNLSNIGKRKFDIIRQIHFYLNVQQKLNLAKIQGQGAADLSQSKDKFSFRPSGLTEDEVKTLRKKLDDMLLRHRNYEELNLDDDSIISEGELLKLLFQTAGDRSEDARDYLTYLNRQLPREGTPEPEPLEYDETFSSDMATLDRTQYSEDDLAKLDAGIDPVTGQPLYEPDVGEVARMSREKSLEREEENKKEIGSQTEISAEDALNMLDKTFGSYDKVKQTLSSISPEISSMVDNSDFTLYDLEEELDKISDTIDSDDLTELESLIDAINSNESINIKILPPKSKSDIRSELYDTAATPEDFAYFVSKFVDTDKPLTLRDLGALMSHGEEGVASDANAVRQGLTKSWFRAMFFSFDDDKKASIYATLADKWFYSLELLDLFKDDTIKQVNQRDMSKTGAARYFDHVKKIMTRPNNIKKFLTDEFEMKAQEAETEGRRVSDDDIQKNQIIDVMLTGNNGFRVFATSLMKDYYTNNVWNQCEQDLAYSIKEYFAKNYSSSNIGKDLPKGQKSRKVKKEQGKTFFDTVIYAVMGRTGIKDSKGSLVTPDKMIDQRKDAFRNKSKFLGRVAKFNAEFPQNRLVSKFGAGSDFDQRDLDALIDDMFDASGVIGGTFTKFQKMSDEEYNKFVEWVGKLKEQDLTLTASQALVLSSASSALDHDEFMKPSMTKAYSKESQGRLKEYMKMYKDQIDKQRKNLKIEDAEYVSYQGQKCEVDDIEMDKKIIHIYLPDDTLVKVPFDQVNLVK